MSISMSFVQIHLRFFLFFSVLYSLHTIVIVIAQSDDHGLAYETSNEAASPAMRSFFHDDGSSSSGNKTELLPVAAERSEGEDPLKMDVGVANGNRKGKTRIALIAVGIVFGVAGVGILVVAVTMYFVQKNRKKREGEKERLRGETRMVHHLEPV